MKISFILLFFLLLCPTVASAETVFVTLEKNNAIAVVGSIAGKLIRTINREKMPRGSQLRPGFKTLYIARWRRPRDVCHQFIGGTNVCV